MSVPVSDASGIRQPGSPLPYFDVPASASVPVCWAQATSTQNYVNLGDALSPVMVAALSGRAVRHANFNANSERIAAVGTVGHNLQNGVVWVWGVGSSDKNIAPRNDARLIVRATRGPVSWKLLAHEGERTPPAYGDPVWLLPRFYPARVEKRYELGVIMHLSEHVGRETDGTNVSARERYRVPDTMAGSVKIIDTITAVSARALAQRLDEILSCRRIVSTSLHGMVIAESYGIPCLYFPPRLRPQGLVDIDMVEEPGINLRFTDLYLGLDRAVMPVYGQKAEKTTDWDAVIKAVDTAWEPKVFDADRLIERFPLPLSPFVPAREGDLFASEVVRGIPFRSAN